MRYDYFLVWGNGLAHISCIVGMIRNHDSFDIVRMKQAQIADMGQFVKDVYACDTAPWHHLIAKTRYLLKSVPKAVFILAINKEPDEYEKGKGEFRHIECRKMTALKIAIRNAFNPRFSTDRRIPPLNAGVSHEHCVHASDYESQTEHVLGVLGLEDITYHKRYDGYEYFIPYHIMVEGNCLLVDRRLDDLLVNILGKGLVKVENTPHYQYVCGDTESYADYFDKYFGTKLCEDHFPAAFDRMIEGFEFDYVRQDGRKSHIIIKGNVILDGVHRAAICKGRGVEKARCIQVA